MGEGQVGVSFHRALDTAGLPSTHIHDRGHTGDSSIAPASRPKVVQEMGVDGRACQFSGRAALLEGLVAGFTQQFGPARQYRLSRD